MLDNSEKQQIDDVLSKYLEAEKDHSKAIDSMFHLFSDLDDLDKVYSVKYFGSYIKNDIVNLYMPAAEHFIFEDFYEAYNSFNSLVIQCFSSEQSWEKEASDLDVLNFGMVSVFKQEKTLKSLLEKVRRGEALVLATAVFSDVSKTTVSAVEWTLCPLIKKADCGTIYVPQSIIN